MGVHDSQIRADLLTVNGNRAVLMQKYSDQLVELLKPFGGSLGDVPMDEDHPIHKLQNKIRRLNTLE